MRFMVMVKANADSGSGSAAERELLTAMGKYNEELVKAGVLLAGEGLQASSKGAAGRLLRPKRTVMDGPFAETKELIAGFWLIQVRSMEEVIEWVKRCPSPHEGGESEIEIRQVFEAEDFGQEFTPELRGQRRGMREQVGRTAKRLGDAEARSRDRRGLADRVGAAHRRAGADGAATSAWPRTSRRTRSSPRWSSGRESGVPDNPGAWLMATAKRRAIDRAPPPPDARAQARGARPRALERDGRALSRTLGRRARRPDRRRPAAADLHRLPSGALDARRASR